MSVDVGLDWDEATERARAADQREVGRASAYLALLGEDEAQRRADTAHDRLIALDDGEDGGPVEVDECPLCGHFALLVTSFDDFGGTEGPGICVVCSYERSDQTAYDSAMKSHFDRIMAKDD